MSENTFIGLDIVHIPLTLKFVIPSGSTLLTLANSLVSENSILVSLSPPIIASLTFKLIRIEANKPSLIRYALAELILHEVAEDEFYSISPNSLDSHSSSEFHALERRWRRRLERAIYDEHYDAEDEEIDQIEQLGGLTN